MSKSKNLSTTTGKKANNKNNKKGSDRRLPPLTENNFRDEDLQSLIQRKKLQLILDLDNTLLHVTEVPKKLSLADKDYKKLKLQLDGDLHDILAATRVVKLRPGLRAFLEEARNLFDLSISTVSSRPYAEEIVLILERSKENNDNKPLFKKIVSKDDHLNTLQKGLDQVKGSERVALIVDDIVEAWRSCDRDNVIGIEPYCYFPRAMSSWPKMKDGESEVDEELQRVLVILREVHRVFYCGNGGFSSKDVRQVLKRVRADFERDHQAR